jgi:hypothetical protein
MDTVFELKYWLLTDVCALIVWSATVYDGQERIKDGIQYDKDVYLWLVEDLKQVTLLEFDDTIKQPR